MKKFFIAAAILMASFAGNANAYEFDGVDLNASYRKVSQAISSRGYVYDDVRKCLKGNCKGTEIYMTINYHDVDKEGYVGQLIVEVPMQNTENAMEHMTLLLNVIYHQVSKTDDSVTYSVHPDGTQMVLTQKGDSFFLTYNTIHYKEKK